MANILPEHRLNPFLTDKLVRTCNASNVPFSLVATTTQEGLEKSRVEGQVKGLLVR